MTKIWDISPAVNPDAPVFPGDTAYQQAVHFSHGPGCPVTVHTLKMSPHTGAHADAPMHYHAEGAGIGTLALDAYIGHCRVIDCTRSLGRVEPADVAHALHDLPSRVLIKTSKTASQSWQIFTAIAPATLHTLKAACTNFCLIGTDTPSLDPTESKDLACHMTLFDLDLRVLENLVLDDIQEGDYELIALPLKLTHCDASPVRAVLRPLGK
jgi:arylformamidase